MRAGGREREVEVEVEVEVELRPARRSKNFANAFSCRGGGGAESDGNRLGRVMFRQGTLAMGADPCVPGWQTPKRA